MNRYNQRVLQSRNQHQQPSMTTILLTCLNLAFTAVTVGIALLTAYFTYFRVSDELHARLTWSRHVDNVTEDSLSVSIAVFNTGNRPALITDLKVAQVHLKNGKPSSWTYTESSTLTPSLPILIEAGHIALVQLGTKYSLIDWHHGSVECDSTEPNFLGSRKANVGLLWTAVNSQGRSFNGAAVVAQLYLNQKSVTGFGTSAEEVTLFAD
jgi:hypothetical protein